MERKIGEMFEYKGEWYQCVEGTGCYQCAFNQDAVTCLADNPHCTSRSDRKRPKQASPSAQGMDAKRGLFVLTDYYKIVACVTAFDGDFEEVLFYGIDGYIVDSQNPKDEDLMMLPEKKEGWVNVYNSLGVVTFSHNPYDTKKEALANVKPKYYVDTVKINWEEQP